MKTLTISTIIMIFLLGCKKDSTTNPQIIFKNGNEILNEDTINVLLNSYHELIVETIYNDGTPHYFKQLNNRNPVDLEGTENLHLLSHSSGSENKVIVEIYTPFPDSIYSINDLIRIKIQVSSLTKSVYYLIVK